MPKTPLPIAAGSYQSEIVPLNSMRAINWVPITPQAQTGSLNPRALLGRAGIDQFSDVGVTINRGAIVLNGVPFFVYANAFFSFNQNGTFTNHGVIDGSGRVSLAKNNRYIVIVVPGVTAYTFDSNTDILAEITDPDFLPSDTVAFKDGFFVFSASTGDLIFTSQINDPTSYNALDRGTAEIKPDKIVAVHVNHNELFVLGEETIEVFATNPSSLNFPFQRIPGANFQNGCYAKFGIVDFDNTFLFVGGALNEETGIWRVISSSAAQKISTPAIDAQIQRLTRGEISEAFAMTYTFGGQFLALFTFETAELSFTYVYNATTSARAGVPVWCEFQSGVNDKRWRVNSIVEAYGKLLVGDNETGKVGALNRDTFTDYGDLIYHEITSQPFSNQGNPIFARGLELMMETGTGLTVGQGENPIIRMQFSDDGGRTFSSEFPRSYGEIGNYTIRPTWRKQGRVSDSRVYRFIATDPVKTNITKMEADVV